jgi:nucleotide-binding universal stress UspA family protein
MLRFKPFEKPMKYGGIKMFERVLLPLDGSELAETAIPYVRDLAGQLGAEVYLLHACPSEHQSHRHMHQIYMDNMAESLKLWIRKNSKPGQEPKIQAEVILGDPIQVIFDYIKQKSISIVALTSHGTSGFREWAMGSVADKVVRRAGIPTLLIRVKEGLNVPDKKGLIQKILLPLDTSDASKIAIPYAVELAKKLKADITLFSMVQTVYAYVNDMGTGTGLGFSGDSIDAATKKNTDEYLQGIEVEIRKAGVEVTHSSNIGLDAAYEILEIEEKIQPDLLVMATRGRSNIARWALGSVAEKVLVEGDRPILMVKETPGVDNHI